MANNNVQNVRFLRNGILFASRQAANAALTDYTLTAEMDGSAILARYSGTTTGETPTTFIKTLVGFVYYKDADNKSITIFDIDDAGSDVDNKIKAAIEALDSNATSTDGKNVQVKVTEVDGKITGVNITTDNTVNSSDVDAAIITAIDNLDYTGVTTGDGVYITNVTEANGVIAATTATLPTVAAISENGKAIIAVAEDKGTVSATAGTINAEYVDVSYSAITATNVKGALAEIADEINAMDKSASAVDGQVVTTVSESDGVVSETKANVKDLQLGGYAKSSSTGEIASTDTINEALSKLENKAAAITIANADGSINVTTGASGTDINVNIKSGEKVIKLDGEGGGIYTDIDLVKITTGLPAEIKERYQLLASDDSQIGANIDIPKDSHIVSINYITEGEHAQNLEYVYINVSGETQTTYVDMSELVLEAEFESGVTATDGVVHGVVDSTSEKNESEIAFLTVGTDGFKISGIKDAIDTKINKLDAVVTGGTTAGTATSNHVQVIVGEADGKLTGVTVSETNIANASDLTQEISDRQSADTELSNRLGANVTTANTAYEQLSALSGTSEDASGVTSVNGAKKYAQQYADEKVAAVVSGLDASVSAETGHISVKVDEVNGVLTAVTLTESDIASASALTAEIAARKAVDGQDGNTYSANASSPYINSATSLNDADVKLASALKSLSDNTINQVKVNGVALTEENNAVNAQISAVAGTGAETAAIAVNTNDSTGAVTISLLGLDCGTY